jgi:catechol 2,3-dioxygenase-like lactoylglutathione lyase family enzyme
MLEAAPIMAFVSTTDLDRARAFYAGKLGLVVTDHSDFAVAFDGGGSRLRVTKVEAFEPQPFTVLGWVVDDIAATLAGLRERGVEFTVYDGMGQDKDGVWQAPGGALIAWFRDPDGNTLSLTQFSYLGAAAPGQEHQSV